MAKMDLPPEFVFEQKGNEQTLQAYVSDSSSECDDASKGDTDSDNKKRKVTFANEPDLPETEYSDDDEIDEEEQVRMIKLRQKRSASLPSIELNRALAKKIRRMLKEDETHTDDSMQRQLSDLNLSQDLGQPSSSEIKYEYEFLHGQLLQVRLGNITEECTDIIVNESNGNLNHASGVAGVIAQKGGKEVQLQSDRWVRKHGPVPPGQVAVTEAGQLPCKWLIHAVGPIWRGGNWREDGELWDAMWNCLVWASKLHARTIAIPALGATSLGFQKERCAYLLIDCIAKFFAKHPKTHLQEIRIVNHNESVTDAVVFEVVGKFTGGCETSESERELEDAEEDDEDFEEVDDDEEDDGMSKDTEKPAVPAIIPITPSPAGSAASVLPRWLPQWRRQSIA